jgi:hypothetical protein
MSEYPYERNLAGIPIAPELVLEWIAARSDIPADATYRRAYYDAERDIFVIIAEHPSFRRTGVGCIVERRTPGIKREVV